MRDVGLVLSVKKSSVCESKNCGLPKFVHFNEFFYQSVLMVLLRWGFECCVGVCCDDSTSLRVARGGCLVSGDYKVEA